MKKKQYIAAVACLVAGVIGFGSVYATEKAQERREEAQNLALEQVEEQDEDEPEAQKVSSVVEPQIETPEEEISNEVEAEVTIEEQEQPAEEDVEAEPTVALEESLHFEQGEVMVWPIEGNVLLNYSMDSTIYFPTLDQYRYNPAVIIQGDINDKVYLVAKGKITDITTNEVTGCTVTEDLGDGYTAIYGQLKELNFDVGDMVEAGQVIGYVSEPTKYYSMEGSNLYFELRKDGEPVNPLEYFE